jgi:hypothetical protein
MVEQGQRSSRRDDSGSAQAMRVCRSMAERYATIIKKFRRRGQIPKSVRGPPPL